jgi:putative transcriptional regulator
MSEVTFAGKLLVANPRLGDPNFERTVVLLLAHGEEGAVGVVLNRPSDLPVAARLPGWAELATPPAVFHSGGPVGPSSAICLARVTDPAALGGDPGGEAGWSPLWSGLGTVDLDTDPDRLAPALGALRIFTGYAGWGPGQLEGEIRAGGWWLLGARGEDPFSPDPEGLWKKILRRQSGELALVAAYPGDPADN